jgi:hypothetical protein
MRGGGRRRRRGLVRSLRPQSAVGARPDHGPLAAAGRDSRENSRGVAMGRDVSADHRRRPGTPPAAAAARTEETAAEAQGAAEKAPVGVTERPAASSHATEEGAAEETGTRRRAGEVPGVSAGRADAAAMGKTRAGNPAAPGTVPEARPADPARTENAASPQGTAASAYSFASDLTASNSFPAAAAASICAASADSAARTSASARASPFEYASSRTSSATSPGSSSVSTSELAPVPSPISACTAVVSVPLQLRRPAYASGSRNNTDTLDAVSTGVAIVGGASGPAEPVHCVRPLATRETETETEKVLLQAST